MARSRSTLTRKQKRTLEGLLARAREEGDLRVWRRAKAVLAYAEGDPVPDICRAVELGRRTLLGCWERYRREGLAGLLEGEHPGGPPRLSVEEQETLCEILDSGPVAYGFETGLWTAPRIAQVIAAEFQVRYHPHHVCKLLHGFGFSVQRPTRQLAAADAKQQQKWVRKTYPALKKGRSREVP